MFYSAINNNANSVLYHLSDDLHNIMEYFFLKDRESYYLQPEDFYKETPKIIITNKSLEDSTYQFLKEMNIHYPFYEKLINSTLDEGKSSVIKDILKNTNNKILSYNETVELNYNKVPNANFFIYNNKNHSNFNSGINFKNTKDMILWLCDKSNKDYIVKNDIIVYKSQNNGYEIFLFDNIFSDAIHANDKETIAKEFAKNKIIIKQYF